MGGIALLRIPGGVGAGFRAGGGYGRSSAELSFVHLPISEIEYLVERLAVDLRKFALMMIDSHSAMRPYR
jgi:hypothetical protein